MKPLVRDNIECRRERVNEIPSHRCETEPGGLAMPTLVKQQVDSNPTSETKGTGLIVVVLLLAIAVAGALLSSIFPLPQDDAPVVTMVPAPDPIFFGP
jgi:hypothetical protein